MTLSLCTAEPAPCPQHPVCHQPGRCGSVLPPRHPRGRPLPPSLRRYRPPAQGVPALLGSPQRLLFPPGQAWFNPRASVLRQSCISRQPVTRSTGRSHQPLVRPLSPALHPAPALSVPGQFPFHPRGVSSPRAVPRCPESGSSIAPDSIPRRSPRCRLCLSVPSAWSLVTRPASPRLPVFALRGNRT